MKVIYDSERPETHRIVVIGKDGKEEPFPCFQIQVENGREALKFGRWGDQKKRAVIHEKWSALMMEVKNDRGK